MPLFKDDKGKDHFAMNPQMGKAKFGSSEGSGSPLDKGKGEMSHHGTSAVFLHAHGDGTYHSEHEGGEKVEHPTLGHALMHMAHHHEPGGKHIHIHSEGGSHTAHTVDENGEHTGPHDHDNLEDLKNNMDQFLTEEGHEGQGGEYGSEGNEQDGGSSDLGHLME